MDNPVIRPCRPSDREAIRDICIRTATIPARTKTECLYLWTMYCDCYTEQFAEYCFVAADAQDRPVGYILCAPDYKAYHTVFVREYLPRLRRSSILRYIAAAGEVRSLRPLARQGYPAHMHIDILEEYQRMGIGTRLFGALKDRLHADGIHGLCLGVGYGNEKGIAFYQKQGFCNLRRMPGSIVMGVRL